MGANHVRVARTIRHAQVSLVVDVNRARARALAEPIGAKWATRLPSVLTGIDAVIVAVPTEAHAAVGVPLLQAGIPILVEKPLAGTLDDAHALVDAATETGGLLMAGHVERFNNAVLELDKLIDSVVHIESTRVGPYSTRIPVGVILDLMIHDLDIVQRIAGAKLLSVKATAQRTRSSTEDLACALLCFENGMTASMTASRIGQNKVRQLEITQKKSTISVDMLRQSVTIYRTSRSEYRSEGRARYRQSGVMEIPFLERRGEPLLLELEHFLECVASRTQPLVSGADGLVALELALAVAEDAGVAAK